MASDQAPRYLDLETLFFRLAMNKSRFPPQLALRIVASLCAQVHAAHVRKDPEGKPLNIVHGTIALPLVILGLDGSVQVLKLPGDSVLQKSPEQAAGFPATVKSDIFNTGLVLYILLTGDHPLLRETEEETREATVAAEIEPPSKLENLPPSLDDVVMKVLARDASQRYPDMKAMQAALEKALEVPGMGATVAEVGELVARLAPEDDGPPGMPPADFEAAVKFMQRVSGLLEASDARGLSSTAALRQINLEPERPRIQVDCFFVDDADAPPAADSADARALYQQLAALGFERLGVKVEVNKANGSRTPSICFASAQHGAFASIFFSFDAVPALYFFSDFEDGSVVLTASYHRRTQRKPRAVHTGHPNQPLARVLEAHRHEVQAFLDKGATLRARWGREERIQSTHAYYDNSDTR